ncbi:HNH endonuclease [Ottowia sp.]|uniref:HNH endonuclease n=1 Tax=Ottowia sp. TaxID=1898956 RepID=UPI00395B757A
MARINQRFPSLDPSITNSGRKGLSGSSKKDREIWDEFHNDWEKLTVECEKLRGFLGIPSNLEITDSTESEEIDMTDYTGDTRVAIIQQRMKQNFFRRAVLASYRGRCCISGVSDARFLVASHIVPWSKDRANRLNPRNGLCLSSIHDKAFDNHLFSLTDDHEIILSNSIKQTSDKFLREIFWHIDGQKIEMPDRFFPHTDFIENHRTTMAQN